jgi:hypothetical protein
MRIYVGGLWSRVGRQDLENLVAEALRGPWYRLRAPRGHMTRCELQQMTDIRGGDTEYCAVIEVEPSRLGWEVVQHLEGLQVNGHRLTSHKWFPRNGLFDRRVGSQEGGAEIKRDRRSEQRNDRRRQLNVQPLGKKLVRAVQGFERSYGS